jgi:AcrR family transcriptional regulator
MYKMFRQVEAQRNSAGDDTRGRLLDAAIEVFLAEGFRAARVQDIAERAGMRLSAINYHFGSKEGLYLAVLQHHADESLQRMYLNEARADTSPPRVRLETIIRQILVIHLSKNAVTRIAQLVLRELASPTPALEVVLRKFTLPMANYLHDLLREILGPAVPEAWVNRAVFSLLGQCVMYSQAQALIAAVDPAIAEDPSLVDSTTRYITDFSWSGLQGIRKQWEDQARQGG